MNTLYHPDTHDTDRPAGSYWAASAGPAPTGWKKMNGDETCEVAIIGAGYTGLSAALHLARLGIDVRVVDAGPPGGGASGRNGGFCCIGAVKLSDQAMIRQFGLDEAKRFYASQREAVALVRALIDEEGIAADPQGDGMLEVAHRPSRVDAMKATAEFNTDTLDLPTRFLERDELVERGFAGREAHGGLHFADGFGLHPLKYLHGLLEAVLREGVPVHPRTRVIGWKKVGSTHRLITRGGSVRARQVLIATNGYTDDALHPAMAGVALPVISSIVTTEPLSEDERGKLGWTTETPLWDSRTLLHYGRLLPDGRLLLGGRGDTVGGKAGQAAATAHITRWFHGQFPDWAMPPISHAWSGLACISARRTPMVGALAADPSVFHALAYHGNGVATGTWAGQAVAALIAGGDPAEILPAVVAQPPKRFALPALRRWTLRAAFMAYGLRDRI